jgi:hypothetical protein
MQVKYFVLLLNNGTYFVLQNFSQNKNISKKLKLRPKNTITDKTLRYESETWILAKRNEMNIFERKVYRRILGPVYDNEKENCSIQYYFFNLVYSIPLRVNNSK